MRKLMMASAAAVLLAGPALAQSSDTKRPEAPSTVDSGSAAPTQEDGKRTPPKTTGAMNKTVDGVATSPQDVAAQQQGKKTAAEGGGDVPGAQHPDQNRGPKTTGAAPGADFR